MQSNPPQTIEIGLPTKKTIKFDDPKELTKQGGIDKINAIKVFFSDKYVVGLTIYYKLADGDYLKAAHNAPKKEKKKYEKRVLEIGPDDYLLEISGHVTEKGITRITFTTYRGKIGTYGSDQGTPFCHKFYGHTFGPLSGGFIDHLMHLEFPVVPVPQAFMNEFKPIQVNVQVNDNIKKVENFSNPNCGQQNFSMNQPNNQFQGMYVNPNQNLANFGKVAQIPTFPQYQQPQQQQFQQFQQPMGQYQPQQNRNTAQSYDYPNNMDIQQQEKQLTKSDLISSKYPKI